MSSYKNTVWRKSDDVLRLRLNLEFFSILKSTPFIVKWEARFYMMLYIDSGVLLALESILAKQKDIYYDVWKNMLNEILNQCLNICGPELFTESCSYYNLVSFYNIGILMNGKDGILMMSHIHSAVLQ